MYIQKCHRPFKWIGWGIGGLIGAAALALLFGLILMWLWNWLMPEIFGLPLINFWQAWGLVIIAHILFKSGFHHKHPEDKAEQYWHNKFRKRFNAHMEEPETTPQPEQ
jgi:high-affinity Fe2+/Pb2+ permease